MAMKMPNSRTPRQLKQIRKYVYRRDLAVIHCLEIDVDGKLIRFSAAEGSSQIQGRVVTIFAKEPTTIPYLETFSQEDVFLDIGANIGLYSIYAAVMTGCKVVCIEPEALNFAELNKNIFLNDLHGEVFAYCAAAADRFEVSQLLLGAFSVGYSHHDFGESTWSRDMKWSSQVTVADSERVRQGSISVSIDHLVSSGAIPQPTHIKIDVDGHEPKVIAGAAKTLADPRLKTVLVEIDFAKRDCQAIIDTLTDQGWRYSMDQLVTNRAAIMKAERVGQLRELGKDGFNYIFYRDPSYGEYFKRFLENYEPPLDANGRMKVAPSLVDG